MKTYDFIFAGGGLAGLSLACHIARSPLSGASMLIVDQDAKQCNDRTFSFWSNQPGHFDPVISHIWRQLAFHAPGFNQLIPLGEYRYQTIRGLDFYRQARQELTSCPGVKFHRGRITGLKDEAEGVTLTVDRQVFSGKWAFDSRFRPLAPAQDSHSVHSLELTFLGWEVEAARDAFDPDTPTFMDFRTPQYGDVRFFYVLPFSERLALVEFSAFTNQGTSRLSQEVALQDYLRESFGLEVGVDCQVVIREGGKLPVTDQSYPRRLGKHTMAIGNRGGRLKPTTGYGFTRIQRDSQAILESLLNNNHPFAIKDESRLYSEMDSMMLEVMTRHPDEIPTIFTALFKKNPIERIFRFLDEDAHPGEIGRLIFTLPPAIFLTILARRLVASRGYLRALIDT